MGHRTQMRPTLEHKRIVLAVTGSIAAVETIKLAHELRRRGAAVTGRLCVIGSKINEQAIKELFNIE